MLRAKRDDTSLDRAIEDKADDVLDRSPFIASLIRALIEDICDADGKRIARRSRGFVVGLTGPWGLGKSSVLNLVGEQLGSMDGVIVAKLNPWLFHGRDEIMRAFFASISAAMGYNLAEDLHDLRLAFNRYGAAIAAAGALGAGALELAHGSPLGLASRLLRRLKKPKPPRTRSIEEERQMLEDKLAKSGRALVVLIDEVDRVEDDEVRAIAQLVKAVGDIRGVSYLVAYDPGRVAEALGRGVGSERVDSGRLYLEKIIQHAVPLRPLFETDVRELLRSALGRVGVGSPKSDDGRAIFDLILSAISTPRDVKRLLGSFSVIEAAVRGEVDPFDVLGYCWILTKHPTVAERMSAAWLGLVDDPDEREALRRASEESNRAPDPRTFLGGDDMSVMPLIRLLFPRFGAGNSSRRAGSRLSRRGNLMRVLYLGDPPGLLHRHEIEALWSSRNAEDAATALRELKEGGRLAALLDRLRDLLSELDPIGDAAFWEGLSKALERDEDWTRGPDGAAELARDATFAIHRLAVGDEAGAERARGILWRLAASDDLIISPRMLRQGVFAYGLGTSDVPRGGFDLMQAAEVRSLVEETLPRIRAAAIEGRLLRRIPSVEAMFLLWNLGAWDEELRAALTAEAADEDGFRTLATLLKPPGQEISRNTVDQIVDAAALGRWFASAQLAPSGNAWVDQAVREFAELLDAPVDPT